MLFDLGGVLADVRPERAAARWEALGYPPDRFDAAFVGSGAKPEGDLGLLDAEGMRRRVEGVVGRAVPSAALREVWGAMVIWRPWVPALIARVTVPYGVLSTIDPVHAAALGPLVGADPIVYSCEIGAVKPDPRAFEAAIARCPVPAEAIRYVDDRADNVAEALRAGLQAVQVVDLPSLEVALADLLRQEPRVRLASPDRRS